MPYSSFSILTLNQCMAAGMRCTHFHLYGSSHPEAFFKKGVLRIFRQFLNIEVINVEVLSKQVKNCLKYISIL